MLLSLVYFALDTGDECSFFHKCHMHSTCLLRYNMTQRLVNILDDSTTKFCKQHCWQQRVSQFCKTLGREVFNEILEGLVAKMYYTQQDEQSFSSLQYLMQ